MPHVVLMTKGTGGDLHPFLAMGVALRHRGNRVSVITHAAYEEAVRERDLDFTPLDHPGDFERMMELSSTLHRLNEMSRYYQQQVEQNLAWEFDAVYRHLQEEQVVLAAHSNCYLSARMASERANVPLASIFLAPIYALGMPILETGLRVFADRLNEHRVTHELPPVTDWRTWLHGADLALGFWPEWFAADEPSWPFPITTVGFVRSDVASNDEVPSAVVDLLRSARPVLITHATSHVADRRFFDACIDACHQGGLPAVVVTANRKVLPHSLPPGILHCPRLPFSQVFPQVRLLVHHGGIGTLAQALAAGVPQLILPIGFDRPDNAARAARLGVAEHLSPPSWTVTEILHAMTRLTTAPTVQTSCHSVATQMQHTSDSVQAACSLVEELARGQMYSTKTDKRTLRVRTRNGADVLSNSETFTSGAHTPGTDALDSSRKALLARLLSRQSLSPDEQKERE